MATALYCRAYNLCWTPRSNKRGSSAYITYDKAKQRFRLNKPGVPRKCFKTEAEAATYLQGVTDSAADNNDDGDGSDAWSEFTTFDEPSDGEGPLSPEEVAANVELDRKYEVSTIKRIGMAAYLQAETLMFPEHAELAKQYP